MFELMSLQQMHHTMIAILLADITMQFFPQYFFSGKAQAAIKNQAFLFKLLMLASKILGFGLAYAIIRSLFYS